MSLPFWSDGASEKRNVAVAIPLKNEAEQIPFMLEALDEAARRYAGSVTVVVVANDCSDASIDLLAAFAPDHFELEWCAVSMLPGCRHAGWARRLALDAAAARLRAPGDLLLSTDADTLVSPDWIVRTAAHIDREYDAVAGQALTMREERRSLGERAKNRLDRIGRYYTALAYLQASAQSDGGDPWPRHFYEGGASIALTLELYRRIGGAPTPSLAEDKALFERVRAHGGRIRHPVDVRVFTSCRIEGRAPGGMADAVALWVSQTDEAPLHEVYDVPASLSGTGTSFNQLCFHTLGEAHAEALQRIRWARSGSNPLPQVEPILIVPLREHVGDRISERGLQGEHGLVGAQRVIGLPGPVNQEDVAA
jgi:cellulose synthase/poly-beta-1,6-N-acetylglucosamine synthase-like glycosyltransferase